SLRFRSESEIMLLLTRTIISSTTVASFGWLFAAGGATAAGGTVPPGRADCVCCPIMACALRKRGKQRTALIFINKLIRQGQLSRVSPATLEIPYVNCTFIAIPPPRERVAILAPCSQASRSPPAYMLGVPAARILALTTTPANAEFMGLYYFRNMRK